MDGDGVSLSWDHIVQAYLADDTRNTVKGLRYMQKLTNEHLLLKVRTRVVQFVRTRVVEGAIVNGGCG
jgi:hypothetical protein